jgi:microcystin-dependent protein
MAESYIGEIRMVGFNFAIEGWAICDGSLLPISEYSALFNLIGTTYGGDGVNTFGIPDMRGRIPIHQGNGYVQGQTGGTETVTLNKNQIPAHTHTLNASSGTGTQSSPASGVWAASSLEQFSPAAGSTPMSVYALSSMGGSQPHNNLPPFLCVNFIISLFGVYPSQN